jgi:hypothetical protein
MTIWGEADKSKELIRWVKCYLKDEPEDKRDMKIMKIVKDCDFSSNVLRDLYKSFKMM